MESLERNLSQAGVASPEEVAREHADVLVRSMLVEHVGRSIEVR